MRTINKIGANDEFKLKVERRKKETKFFNRGGGRNITNDAF